MRSHLLVTNDFPPKVGGIQSYLWELWRRLPSGSTTVYCTPHPGSVEFDVAQNFRIERSPEPVLLPYPWLVSRVRSLADEVGAELVIFDPALPLGALGPALGRPYGVVLHGAEVTIPARLPLTRYGMRRVLNGASLVISAGEYALKEAEACVGSALPSVVVPPGVDTHRFEPLSKGRRGGLRNKFAVNEDAQLVVSVSRLVPRKGMDKLVRAAAALRHEFPNLQVLIAGTGREAPALRALIGELQAPVTLLGRISDDEVGNLYAIADVMAMICHDRWRGLEQEGFGIVFLEAGACGIPQIAGQSGGAAEAVVDGVTGIVVQNPRNEAEVESALRELLSNPPRRERMGRAARDRVVKNFDYDLLAARLEAAIESTDLGETLVNGEPLL